MTATRWNPEPRRRGGRMPNALLLRYMAQYGASERQVRILGIKNLVRMQPHARATMFAERRWAAVHRRWEMRPGGVGGLGIQRTRGADGRENDPEVLARAFSALASAPIEMFQNTAAH